MYYRWEYLFNGKLKPKGVDVSVLSPGLTKTAMAAGAGVDWSKLPMAEKKSSAMAEIAINGLGKRFLSIPGIRYKLISWMANLTPLGMQAKIDEMKIKRAIHTARL